MTTHVPSRHQWVALIVDDERDNLPVASMGLEFHQIRSYANSSGQEALAILKTVTPTFILLDLDMPTMNGYEVLQAIREQAHLQNVMVFCMTANQVNNIRTDILERGFDAFLEKPFSIRDLGKTIEKALEQFYQRQSLGIYS
jgi:CheY-like chemotaxis protein